MQLLLFCSLLGTAFWLWLRESSDKEEKITGNLALQYVWVFYQFISINQELSDLWLEFKQSVKDFSEADSEIDFYRACSLLNQRVSGLEIILNKPELIVLAGDVSDQLLSEIKRVSNLYATSTKIDASKIMTTISRDGTFSSSALLEALRMVK